MKNKIFSLANQVLASGFSFLVIIISSRLLTPDNFGALSLIIMITILISVIPQSLITMPIMSNSFKENDINRYFFHNSILLISFLFIISLLFILFYANNYYSTQKYFSFWSVLFYFSTFQIYDFIKKLLFVNDKHKLATFYELIKTLSASISIIFFINISTTIGIDEILISLSIGYIFFSLYEIRNIQIENFSLKYLKELSEKNFVFGKWIFASNLIQNINSNFYMYVAAMLLPLSTIGALNAVRSLIGFSTVIFLALDNYLIPKYAQMYLQNTVKKLEDIVKATYKRIGIILIFLYVLIAFFSENILSIIYGEHYRQYGYFLYIFLSANIFMFYTRPILILAKTIGITKILFLASLPTLIFVLLTTFNVINTFKTNGALFIMCVSQLIYLVSLTYFYKKELIETTNKIKVY